MEWLNIRDTLREFIETNHVFIKFHEEDIIAGYNSINREPNNLDIPKYQKYLKDNVDTKKHNTPNIPPKRTNCQKLLSSVMDEAERYYADEYAEFLLLRSDMADSSFFRNLISRKELSNSIEYANHRDHAAHTVYNYLLGWYFYVNCEAIQELLNIQIDHLQNKLQVNKIKNEEFFGNAWINASLMHDIGYVFDGSIPSLSNNSSNEHIKEAAATVQNFFNHRFWYESRLDTLSIKEVLKNVLQFSIEDFSEAKSMVQLGDMLTSLPNIDQIKNDSEKVTNIFCDKYLKFIDSFELWRLFSKHIYPYQGQNATCNREKRLLLLKKQYYEKMYRGMKGKANGIRTIDHGVSSGLLLLLYHSYFYTIYFQLKNVNPEFENLLGLDKDRAKKEYKMLKNFVTKTLPYPHYSYYSEWYFAGILWATSATALHNIQQENPDVFSELGNEGRLTAEEDPLAYLGILVDIIQEWNRERVHPNTIFFGELPVQSNEVDIRFEHFDGETISHAHNFTPSKYEFVSSSKKIAVVFEDSKIAKRVGQNLTKCLVDSHKYVIILDNENYKN